MGESNLDSRVGVLEGKCELYQNQFEEFKQTHANFREETRQDLKDIKEEQIALHKIATSIEIMAVQMTSISDKVNETYDAQKQLADSLHQSQEDLEHKVDKRIDSVDSRVSKIESTDTDKKAAIVDKVVQVGSGMIIGAILLFIFKAMFPTLPF